MKITESPGSEGPSMTWAREWVNHTPELKLMAPRNIEPNRDAACHATNLSEFFDSIASEIDAARSAILKTNFIPNIIRFS